ncbi:MAG: UDP-glucose/GDP-mannose dehydrogenase family protein [Xanthobacteraceae bacterium]|nr:UDP-glucose/GDP-mannose dehydrogenase family protein [Xanthobacteraceae bacterium]QYK44146.1 MAG: UDP-glucose/GDP-mannose dehydrogenase family protein [Xanthobacteraceae bacterium]
MHIVMIGAGYVGLVSGTCFADFGHTVTCVDTDAAKIDALKNGRIPIFEPGLEDLVARNVREGRLHFTGSIEDALKNAEVVFIAVGTPSRRGDGHADISYVLEAARDIARNATGPLVVVTKSTVPVGTGDEIEKVIAAEKPKAKLSVASNPEFLREGAAIEDFKRPDRIVIGTNDDEAREVMAAVYRPLNLNQVPILFTARRTAELIKYAANAFLATKITFINEMADLAEKVGANVQEVARGIGLDNRIGGKFLHAGPGYGGSCFPKDTLALIRTAREAGAPSQIVESVVAVNDARKKAMAERVIAACGGNVKGKTVAVLGLAFKPNTDDMRDAPSLAIIPALQEAGAKVRAHDPESMKQASAMLKDVAFAEGPYEAANGAHALVIITEWDAYRALDLDRIKSLLADPVVVDMRNIYRPAEMLEKGFRYVSIGRPLG